MKDIDNLIILFDKFGVDYDIEIDLIGHTIVSLSVCDIGDNYSRKITGTRGLFAEFLFRRDGSFDRVGIWE